VSSGAAPTKPGVICYFLRRGWGSKKIDEALWAYDVPTTQATGAEHAPRHFLVANLISADIHMAYDAAPRAAQLPLEAQESRPQPAFAP